MLKFNVILLGLLFLQACAARTPKEQTTADNKGYFADASDCYQLSLNNNQVKLPTGTGLTVLEVPIAYDAGTFSDCMRHAGHPAPKANPEDYLEVSQGCLHEAGQKENPDNAYAECIRKGNIAVDVTIERKAK